MNNNFDEIKDDVQRILENVNYITAFLCGSKAIGLAHDLSDTDVMILSDSDYLNITCPTAIELQIVSMADIEKAINDVSDSKFIIRNSQILLANLYYGIPLLNSQNFNAIKKRLPWETIIRNMVADRLRGYKFYKQDAYKFCDTLDCISSKFCFQRSLESLIDAYMFSNYRLIVKEKWRIKGFRQLSIQLCDEFIELYMTIWSEKDLENVMPTYELYCKKIFQLIIGGQL